MVELLSIGATVSTRQSSDLVPYLPRFRRFFAPLPKTAAQMALKTMRIAVTDILCVTRTIIKVGGPLWYLRIRKGIDTCNRSILSIY